MIFRNNNKGTVNNRMANAFSPKKRMANIVMNKKTKKIKIDGTNGNPITLTTRDNPS